MELSKIERHQLCENVYRYIRNYLKENLNDKAGQRPIESAIAMFMEHKGNTPYKKRKDLVRWAVAYCINNKVIYPPKRTRTLDRKIYSTKEAIIVNFAKELTKNATVHEKKLKKELELNGVAFHFQKPIIDHKSYIIDFCIETTDGRRFAIELDGPQHYTKKGKKADKIRDKYLLSEHQIYTFRFPNPRNKKELDYIVSRILASNPKRRLCYDMDELDK